MVKRKITKGQTSTKLKKNRQHEIGQKKKDKRTNNHLQNTQWPKEKVQKDKQRSTKLTQWP